MHATPPPPASTDSWDGHERGTPEFRAVRLALLFAGIVTFAQLYAPQAVLPQISADFGVDASHASLMVSFATLGVALSAIPWSIVADRFGRVRVMAWSVTSATLLAFVTAGIPWFEASLAVRFLEGLALGGVPAVALAYLNEEVTRRSAPLVAGTFVAGNTIGGLSGRLLAAIGDFLGWRIGLLSVSVLAVAATIAFLVVVPQPRGFTPPARGTSTTLRSLRETAGHLRAHLTRPALIGTYLQPLLLMGGFVAIYNFLGFRLLADPYRLPATLVALAFLAYLTGSISSPIAGTLAARFPRKLVLLVCTSLMLIGVLLTLTEPLWLILAGLVLLTGAFFAAHSVAAGIAGGIPTRGRAQSSAIYNLAYYLGSSLFGFLGGLAYVAFGWAGTAWMVVSLIVVALTAALWLIPLAPPPGRVETEAATPSS